MDKLKLIKKLLFLTEIGMILAAFAAGVNIARMLIMLGVI